MKLTRLQELEDETIVGLQARAKAGDNGAARVLLEHFRATSVAIEDWRKAQDAERFQKRGPQAPR